MLNQASRLQTKEIIYIEANDQTNKTVINKWIRDERDGCNYIHAEGVESIDDCSFTAPIVIQVGKNICNEGISVNADIFEDQGVSTINMPAKIVLHNVSHMEESGFFNEAVSHIDKKDDVLMPSRYHVNYYKSLAAPDGRETEVKFGYTLIDAGADIIITKDIKEDIPVEEKHTLEIHEEKSGFCLFGGVSMPDSLGPLKAIHAAYKNDNMIGLTTSTISAVAKGIRIFSDASNLSQIGALNEAGISSLLQVMSRFIQGPSVQFGSRSMDLHQWETITHGNDFEARKMKFFNKRKSTFAGTYKADEIDIRTQTFITFALPHVIESEVSMHQSGVNMDLLSFALALLTPQIAGAMGTLLQTASVGVSGIVGTEAAVATTAAAEKVTMGQALLGATSVSLSNSNNRMRQVSYNQTVMLADKIKIEADNGHITHSLIKAGLVHAIFTNDLVIETLANEFEQTTDGNSFAFGLPTFDDLVDGLKKIAASTTIGQTDIWTFEKKIDDYAAFVGKDEFYLKVGNALLSKSAFFGMENHDPAKEHIEAKEIHREEVPQFSESYDRSFTLNLGDLMTVVDAVMSKDEVPQQKKKRINESEEEKIVREKLEKNKEEVIETASCIENIESELKNDLVQEIGEKDTADISKKKVLSSENKEKLAEALTKASQKLKQAKAVANSKSKPEDIVENSSLKTKNAMFDTAIKRCDNALSELNNPENATVPNARVRTNSISAKEEFNELAVIAKWIYKHPKESAKILGNESKQAWSGLVNDPDIRTFFNNLDKVPEATVEVAKDGLRFIRGGAKRIISMSADDWKGTWHQVRDSLKDRYASRPIEGTAKAVLDICTLLTTGKGFFNVSKEAGVRQFGESILREPHGGFVRIGNPVKKGAAAKTGSTFSETVTEGTTKGVARETATNASEKTIQWGIWDDLPKEMYNGKLYAKIGDRYYSQHAVEYMTPKNMREILNIPADRELRGIPPSVIENAIKKGNKMVSSKCGEDRILHICGDVTVVTDISSKIIISLGKRTK